MQLMLCDDLSIGMNYCILLFTVIFIWNLLDKWSLSKKTLFLLMKRIFIAFLIIFRLWLAQRQISFILSTFKLLLLFLIFVSPRMLRLRHHQCHHIWSIGISRWYQRERISCAKISILLVTTFNFIIMAIFSNCFGSMLVSFFFFFFYFIQIKAFFYFKKALIF